MAVFKVDKEFGAVLNPEAAKLVPELEGLDKKQLLYVILVMDYRDSPYRKKPFEERKNLAKKRLYKNIKADVESAKVKLAMDAYHGLVFDIRLETLDVYKKKVLMLQKETLKEDISYTRLKELDQAINFLEDRINKIQHEIDIEEEADAVELKAGRKLSQIERWQRRQKAYKEYKESL